MKNHTKVSGSEGMMRICGNPKAMLTRTNLLSSKALLCLLVHALTLTLELELELEQADGSERCGCGLCVAASCDCLARVGTKSV